MKTLGKIKVLSFVSGANQRYEETGRLQDFFVLPQTWRASPQSFQEQGGII